MFLYSIVLVSFIHPVTFFPIDNQVVYFNSTLRYLALNLLILLFLFWSMQVSYDGNFSSETPLCCFRRRREICQNKTPCLDVCLFEQYLHLNHFGDQAFVLETSGASTLDSRQACSLQSLAKHNPHLTIHLLMTGPRVDLDSVNIKTLRTNYLNVFITKIDLDDYFIATPLEFWYFCSDWKNGKYRVAHLSDALRLLTLYKYGGYYFDLDIIHLRSLTSSRNFIVAEDETSVANGVMHFDYQHPFIQMAVQSFTDNYQYNKHF